MTNTETTIETGTVRIAVSDLAADIASNDNTVTDWVTRYFGSWWNATPTPEGATAPVQVTATVDADRFLAMAVQVDTVPHETVEYARKPLHLLRSDVGITAHDSQVAYHIAPDGGPITIVGREPGRVASAASRLAREALRGQLAASGWVLLHASAVVDENGRAWVAFGGKGAGKTSTALQFATANGWSILANDRLFAHPNRQGHIEVLPWPAAAAVGLGLLNAGGWYDAVAAARDELHSSTPAELREAFARGDRQPLRADGRELKAQLFPDQLTTLLGIPLASTATIATVLLPFVDSQAELAAVSRDGRETGPDQDAFHADIEDRYPPIWGLRQPETTKAQMAVFDQLNRLPRYSLTLTHHIDRNRISLTSLANALCHTEE